MTVRVDIIDMKMKCITLEVDKSITIGELRKLFDSKGGDSVNNQWKCEGEILSDDNQRLQDVKGFDSEGMTISVTSNVRGGGADTNTFVNLSDEFVTKRNVSYDDSIPDWRCVTKGINLYGICENSRCEAKGEEVIMRVYGSKFDLYEKSFMGICPMCGKHFDLDTCGFYYCDYKCEGTYFDKEKDDWIDLPEDIKKTSDNKISKYDPEKVVEGKQGKVKYKKLILKVVKYHDEE